MTVSTSNVTVVICAYTERRWDDLAAAVRSVQAQSLHPLELILVIDHNPQLAIRSRAAFPDVTVLENTEARGLSGARNTAIATAHGDILAFMDEDAVAEPHWLERLVAGYVDESVVGVGGSIVPDWLVSKPAWFPAEFLWVVGCTYLGMPESVKSVRNLIGCNMSFRAALFQSVGGFRNDIGRVGTRPVGCEETELCIRARQNLPGKTLIYEPLAVVHHRVPANRCTWAYFLSRCYSEGLSKALVSLYVGSKDGLASERAHATKTLPDGVIRGIKDTFSGRERRGFGRSFAIFLGLLYTAIGFITGSITLSLSGARKRMAMPLDNKVRDARKFLPVRVMEIELSEPLPSVPHMDVETGQEYGKALVLARLHSQPLGNVSIAFNGLPVSAAQVGEHIWTSLSERIVEHMSRDGITINGLGAAGLTSTSRPRCLEQRAEFLARAPFISVVIATHNRAASLARTLDSLARLEYPSFEVIVVDNAPGDDATRELITSKYPHVRYVREDQAGLATAHNCGLQAVTAPFVAFTDDDVEVDRHWLTTIAEAFDLGPAVACVTGMILPAELQTPAQLIIEEYGYSKGFNRRVFDLKANRPAGILYPYTAGVFGSGANMAFRTSAVKAIGGFDPALGAGSLAKGGDDLSGFFNIVTAGYQLVYQPASILRHWHRREYDALLRQAYGYGVGLTAYLASVVVHQPLRLFDMALRAPFGMLHALRLRTASAEQRAAYPLELARTERRGMLTGPALYIRSARQCAQIKRARSAKSGSV